jgi:sporulation protein YqfD
MVELELTSADTPGSLSAINSAGITVYNAQQAGDLTFRFSVQRGDHRALRALAKKRGEVLKYSDHQGIYWAAKQLLKRPVLLLGWMLILGLTLYLPTHVFFVEVEGNVTLPTRLIIDKAEGCGLSFGAHRREVRSEKMKNALLQAIPELQWAGVNTYGCRAVISVRERTVPEKQKTRGSVSSIVAIRDGVIRELTVQSGSPVCKVGQAVKAGQVLISGYSDLELCIRATQARGEVFAETQRDLKVILPVDHHQRGKFVRQEKKISFIIGKKQINFCKDSGISDSSCDKMYLVNYMTLPGGFELPVALVTEVWTWYETTPGQISEETAGQILSDFSGHYLTGIMTAGQIQQREEVLRWQDGFCCLQGRYACAEMIGKSRLEENLNDYGEDH